MEVEVRGKLSLRRLLLIGTIAALAACLLCGALAGCSSSGTSSKNSKFLGTWGATMEQTGDDGFNYNYTYVLTINSDKTWTMSVAKTGTVLDTDYGTGTLQGTWATSGDTLNLSNETVANDDFSLTISSDGSTLSDSTIVLTKQTS